MNVPSTTTIMVLAIKNSLDLLLFGGKNFLDCLI